MHQILKIQDRIFMYINWQWRKYFPNMNISGLPGETSTSANRRLFLKNTEITSSSKSHASDAKWQKNVSCIKNELKRSKHETARSSNTHNTLQV